MENPVKSPRIHEKSRTAPWPPLKSHENGVSGCLNTFRHHFKSFWDKLFLVIFHPQPTPLATPQNAMNKWHKTVQPPQKRPWAGPQKGSMKMWCIMWAPWGKEKSLFMFDEGCFWWLCFSFDPKKSLQKKLGKKVCKKSLQKKVAKKSCKKKLQQKVATKNCNKKLQLASGQLLFS